jgi:hypothetical protein
VSLNGYLFGLFAVNIGLQYFFTFFIFAEIIKLILPYLCISFINSSFFIFLFIVIDLIKEGGFGFELFVYWWGFERMQILVGFFMI